MSDNEAKSGAWTEAAKFQFLLRIVAHLREDGRPIAWSKVKMPGRTTKSLQNMWTKIQKEVAALDDGNPSDSTPKKSTPAKVRGKKPAVEDEDEDENDGRSGKATPRKRVASDNSTAKSAKKPKKETGEMESFVKDEMAIEVDI